MKTPLHSIRWRVQAWHGLILLVVVVAFCLTAYQLAWNNQLRRIDQELFSTEHLFAEGIMHAARPLGESPDHRDDANRPPPGPPEAIMEKIRTGQIVLPRAVTSRFEGTQPGYAYYLMTATDGRVLLRSDNVPLEVARSDRAQLDSGGNEAQTFGTFRQIVRMPGRGFHSIVGRDITPDLDELRYFAWSLVVCGAGVWLLGLVGGWWLAGHAIKPIETISRTATRIAAGDLDERISPEGTDSELDQLGRVLNDTFDRLQATLKQQRQFTADASHELRTPVTVILSETRRILKRERTAEEYQEAIRTCEVAGARMKRLIESLLLLEHQENAGIAAARREDPCDLVAVTRAVLDQLQPLAAERNIALHPPTSLVTARGDTSALVILVNNLVANAIQHHQGGGHVWVELGLDNGRPFVEVCDDGPGIAAEDLPHLFERFYRADKARSGTGHSGLGLAIAKTIADNHRARLTVKSDLGHGTTFRLLLPR